MNFCPYCLGELERSDPDEYYCPDCCVTIPAARAYDVDDLAREVKELEQCKAELTPKP